MDIRDEFLGKCTDFCIINITIIIAILDDPNDSNDDNGTHETIDSASEQVEGVATKKAKLRTGTGSREEEKRQSSTLEQK